MFDTQICTATIPALPVATSIIPSRSEPGWRLRTPLSQSLDAPIPLYLEVTSMAGENLYVGNYFSVTIGNVCKALEGLIARYGTPERLFLEDGEVLRDNRFLTWAAERRIELRYELVNRTGKRVAERQLGRPQMPSTTPGWKSDLLRDVEEITLPDLGARLTHLGSRTMYFANVRMGYFTITKQNRAITSTVHEWAGRPHAVRYELSWPMLGKVLDALPNDLHREIVRGLQGRITPARVVLPQLIRLKGIQCQLGRLRQTGERPEAYFLIREFRV